MRVLLLVFYRPSLWTSFALLNSAREDFLGLQRTPGSSSLDDEHARVVSEAQNL